MPKPMTARAIAANRANAQKSTGSAGVARATGAPQGGGPATPEGKARVSQNAVKHGLLAESIIPPALEPYESRPEFDALLAALRDEHRPATVTEDLLVQSIAANHWRLKRLGRVESALIARRQDAVRRDDAFGMPEPHTGIAQLQAALAAQPIDLPALRAIFVFPGSQREAYPDAAIVELAQGTLANLQARHEAALARWRQLAELESSLPATDTTHRLGRYGADLNRQIIHALRELRELKALRKAEQEEAEAEGPCAEPEKPDPQPDGLCPDPQACSTTPANPIPVQAAERSRRGNSRRAPSLIPPAASAALRALHEKGGTVGGRAVCRGRNKPILGRPRPRGPRRPHQEEVEPQNNPIFAIPPLYLLAAMAAPVGEGVGG